MESLVTMESLVSPVSHGCLSRHSDASVSCKTTTSCFFPLHSTHPGSLTKTMKSILAVSHGFLHRTGRVSMAAGTGSRRTRVSMTRVSAVTATVTEAPTDLREVIELLMARTDLSEAQTAATMESLIAGAEVAQISAFLVLLRAKGETPEEVFWPADVADLEQIFMEDFVAGLAKAMRSVCVPVVTGENTLDIVGTGGDGANTVNISTGACVLAAACGAKVAKHGNRSVSSACGSADVLEALGVAVDLGPEGVARCVKDVGVGFMFAPRYHPAMKIVGPVRKALKVRTAFNILGPMLNPSMAPCGLIGVYNEGLVGLMAKTLQRLDIKRALVVHSKGLDEISPMGPADMLEVTPGGINRFYVDPLDLGIPRCTVEDLKGGDKAVNASILREVFAGQRGAVANALILNAGAGLMACGVAKDVKEGVAMAQEVQQSGLALKVLDDWVSLSQELRQQEDAA